MVDFYTTFFRLSLYLCRLYGNTTSLNSFRHRTRIEKTNNHIIVDKILIQLLACASVCLNRTYLNPGDTLMGPRCVLVLEGWALSYLAQQSCSTSRCCALTIKRSAVVTNIEVRTTFKILRRFNTDIRRCIMTKPLGVENEHKCERNGPDDFVLTVSEKPGGEGNALMTLSLPPPSSYDRTLGRR